MKKLRKSKLLKIVLLTLAFLIMFKTYAFAWGTSLNSLQIPSYVPAGEYANYMLFLNYNSYVLNIPIPGECQIGAELPWGPLQQPKMVGGFTDMEFVATTGTMTGETVWESYKRWWICGRTTQGFNAEVVGDYYDTSGKGYVGVGNLPGFDYYFYTHN